MSTARWISPLRYPGGKARMAAALAEVFQAQAGTMDIEVWVEPFAGGAGAGLHLLDGNVIDELWLTEKNPALAAFWRCVVTDPARLGARVADCQPDMSVWHGCREVVAAAQAGECVDDVELALAALVINRCSRSGIVDARVGPIGGKHQDGRWHIRSRWNGDGLVERITAIGRLGERIRVAHGDGISRIEELDGSVGIEDEMLLFVDPPYLVQGNRLYAEGLTVDDHKTLAYALANCPARWLLTYDSDPRILELYPQNRVLAYEIPHTANQRRVDEEYAVLSDNLAVRDDQRLLAAGASRWVQRGPAQVDGGGWREDAVPVGTQLVLPV